MKDGDKEWTEEEGKGSESSVSETKKDELIMDRSIEDVTKGKTSSDHQKTDYNFFWLPVGIALGTAIGISTDKLALWLLLGVAFGTLMGAIKRRY